MSNLDKEKNEHTEYFLSEVLNMDVSGGKQVAMANSLLAGKSSLSLNSIKLLRLAITQISMDDITLKPYKISIKEFSNVCGIDSSNMYKNAENICEELMKAVVHIGDGNPRHKWKKFQWVTRTSYESGYIYIELHEDLAPYLLMLKGYFTKYYTDNILCLKTVHGLRLYELIKCALQGDDVYGDKEADIRIPISVIRRATDTEDKYISVSAFTRKVVDSAVRDINSRPFGLYITYSSYKEGRAIAGYVFHVMSDAGRRHKEKKDAYEILIGKDKDIDNSKITEAQQYELSDYLLNIPRI